VTLESPPRLRLVHLLTALIAVVLATPPVGYWWLLFFVLPPDSIAKFGEQPFHRIALCAAFFGLAFAAVIPVASLRWGLLGAVGWWMVPATWAVACGVLARALAGVLPAPFSIAAAVATVDTLCLEFFDGSIFILLVLPAGHPAMSILCGLGLAAGDGILALAFTSPLYWRLAAGVVAFTCAVLTSRDARTDDDGTDVRHSIRVAVVHPGFSTQDYGDAQFSLLGRHFLSERLAQLTLTSLDHEPDVVVWPENGSGGPTGHLPLVVERLSRMLAGRDTVIVAPGPEYSSEHTHHSAFWISRDGLFAVSRKRRPVPGIETALSSSEAVDPVALGSGTFAGLLCFDSLVNSSYSRLAGRGVDVVLISTDHSALVPSAAQIWHERFTSLYSLEYGLTVVFATNVGQPHAFVSGRRAQLRAVAPGVSVADLPRSVNAARRPVDARLGFLAALLGVLALAVRRRRGRNKPADESFSREERKVARYCLLSVLPFGALLAHASLLPLTAQSPRNTARALLDAARRAFRDIPVSDQVARLFLQSQDGRCGHSAAAYAATWLGDEVFEEDVVHTHGGERLYLGDIASFVEGRGFDAYGFSGGDPLGALMMRPGSVVVAHLAEQHFVVIVLNAGRFLAFDPALGHLVPVDDALLARASGLWLLVSFKPLSI
jgi:hypothetical protein